LQLEDLLIRKAAAAEAVVTELNWTWWRRVHVPRARGRDVGPRAFVWKMRLCRATYFNKRRCQSWQQATL